jgi:hypothetical protein
MRLQIGDVKKAIETTYNHPVASQRLIFSGKVLEDDKTVASYNIEANKMVVLYLKVRRTEKWPQFYELELSNEAFSSISSLGFWLFPHDL